MKLEEISNAEHLKLLINVIQREKQELQASGTLASETLAALNVSIDALPQKHQQLLTECANRLAAMNITDLDPIAISQRISQETSDQILLEYNVLELKQKNIELQRQIDRNKKFLEELRQDLEECKESLAQQNPNPDNVQEHLRQMKQKLASYEEIHEKAKAKFTKLHVPEGILPKSLEELAARLTKLKEEEALLKQRADDVTLARQARDTLNRLRR